MKTQKILPLTFFYLMKFAIGLITKHFLVLYGSGIFIIFLVIIAIHEHNFGTDIFIFLDDLIGIIGLKIPEGSIDGSDLYIFVGKLILLYASIELIVLILFYQVFGHQYKRKPYNPRIIGNIACITFIYIVLFVYFLLSKVRAEPEAYFLVFMGVIAYAIHIGIYFIYVLFCGLGRGIVKEKIDIHINI